MIKKIQTTSVIEGTDTEPSISIQETKTWLFGLMVYKEVVRDYTETKGYFLGVLVYKAYIYDNTFS